MNSLGWEFGAEYSHFREPTVSIPPSDGGRHRVVYLHREARMQERLPRLLERVLSAIRRADAARWRQLLGRPVAIRPAELHIYAPGGAVDDPQHRELQGRTWCTTHTVHLPLLIWCTVCGTGDHGSLPILSVTSPLPLPHLPHR